MKVCDNRGSLLDGSFRRGTGEGLEILCCIRMAKETVDDEVCSRRR